MILNSSEAWLIFFERGFQNNAGNRIDMKIFCHRRQQVLINERKRRKKIANEIRSKQHAVIVIRIKRRKKNSVGE